MAEKFQNKYRIASARLQNWDYRWAGAYFITICTAGREHYFGEIENGKMNLSNLGVIADIFWHEIPARKPNIKLGEYVIMPNHMHGVLIIENHDVHDRVHIVETLHATSLQYEQPDDQQPDNAQPINPSPDGHNQQNQPPHQKNEIMSKKSPKPNSISTIIRSYKSAVTKHANRLNIPNGWQTRFHDHIIRNDAEYERISKYIKNNPANWKGDKFYKNE